MYSLKHKRSLKFLKFELVVLLLFEKFVLELAFNCLRCLKTFGWSFDLC